MIEILIVLKVLGSIGLGVLAVELYCTLRKVSRYIDRQEERQKSTREAFLRRARDRRSIGW